jgi:hypothetical protein
MNRIVAFCRSRRFRFVGLALLTAGALVVAGAWLVHFDEYRRFASVEPGMSEDEVLQVIGKPPGEYGPAGAKYGRSIWFC